MWILGFTLMQIIVFGVVLYFYKKITAGDTENTVKRLGAVYEDLLKKQKVLSENLEAAEKDYQAKKEEASLLADKLSSQAMEEVRKKEEEILKKARVEAENILSKTHASRDQLVKEMEIAASKKMVDFAAGILGNVYDEKLKVLIHAQFIKNFIEHAKKSNLGSIELQGHPTFRTAFAFAKEERELLRQVLAERLGVPDLQIEEAVDESLIAGVVMQIGTLTMDGSFANDIRESTRQVKEKLQS